MEINLEYMDMCKSIYAELEETQKLLKKATRPVLRDYSLMRPICEVIDGVFDGEKKSVVTRAKILILMYLYAPSRLVCGDMSKSRDFSEIVKAIGVNNVLVSMYKKEVLDYYRFNKWFRKKVDDAMNVISQRFF